MLIHERLTQLHIIIYPWWSIWICKVKNFFVINVAIFVLLCCTHFSSYLEEREKKKKQGHGVVIPLANVPISIGLSLKPLPSKNPKLQNFNYAPQTSQLGANYYLECRATSHCNAFHAILGLETMVPTLPPKKCEWK
jgi:hypothetical protein